MKTFLITVATILSTNAVAIGICVGVGADFNSSMFMIGTVNIIYSVINAVA